MTTRKRSTRDKLALARAELRGLRRAVNVVGVPSSENGGPPRFTQVATVRRGFADILHALDESGQVWELKTTLGDKVAGQPRAILSAWWEKVTMERR